MPEFTLNTRDIYGQPLGRVFTTLERVQIDPENERVVLDVVLATDTPIYQWFGAFVILDMAQSSIRMDRMKASGAALWRHNGGDHVGRWQNFRIEKGKLRADCKFSRSPLGEEKLQDVKDEVLVTTSIGFSMYDLEPEIDKRTDEQMYIDGTPVFRCKDYEPFETSWEPIPADIGAGTNRALDPTQILKRATQRNSTSEENNTMPENPVPAPAAPAVDPAAPVETRTSPELAIASEIRQWGETLNAADFATQYLQRSDAEVSVAAFRTALKASLPAPVPVPVPDPASAAARSAAPIETLVSSQVRGNLKSFRGPDAHKNALRAGMFLLAQFAGHERAMQYCDTHGIQYTRVMSGRDNSKGGVFVIPEIESAIIDLRIEYGVIRRNANVVQMNSDTKWVPRRVSGLTAYPVGPGQSGTYSDMTYDQVELVARKWMVLTKIEDELEEDSVISFADKFADEAAYAFTYAEDRVGFLGTGAGTDHGIIGIIPKITAATASIVTAAGNTFAEITEANLLSMIGLLPQFARRAGRNKWYGSNVVWANVLARLAFAKGGVTYTEMSGQMVPTFMGYPFENVEVMPVTDVNSQISLLFGNMSQAVTFGDRRGVTIKMADENDKDFEKDLTTMKATERFDLNAHDVGSTTAAGPLVALQMAGS